MRDASIEAFWARFVTRAGDYPRASRAIAAACERARVALPVHFVALLTRAAVARVDAPELRVGAVGDWLDHALERHAVMRALADAHDNPCLAAMVPFGDTPRGLEVALDLRVPAAPRVVWLDPARYDAGESAVARVDADGLEAYLRAGLGGEWATGNGEWAQRREQR